MARHFSAVAISKEGMLAAPDKENCCICLFDRESESVKTIKVRGSSGLVGITFTKNGHIAVSDLWNRLLIFSVEGNLIKTIHLKGIANRLAVSSDGSIYICEVCRHCISVYNEEGDFQFKFGSKGNGPGQFDFLFDITFGPDGLLYVCGGSNQRIQIFKEDGSYVSQFKTELGQAFISMCVT